jgi:EAL domain-containing protein (putative c-di-GMP-specific phosphodiesterase class I)
MPISGSKTEGQIWYLEGYVEEGKSWIIDLKPLPYAIGRQQGANLRLSSSEISRRHAEIFRRDNNLWIREFGSTNGTFVNRKRVKGEQILQSGDIIHFGRLEFRIYQDKTIEPIEEPDDITQDPLTTIADLELPHGFLDCEDEFDQLIRENSVVPHFQPIVRLKDGRTLAYELLARGSAANLPTAPPSLLLIAKRLHKEVRLSELFRHVGVQQACRFGIGHALFVNTVPAEMDLRYLRHSLEALRTLAPMLPLVVEVHETAITSLTMMRELQALLTELDIELAYDDFGVGQARLVELMSVPPAYLKFDMSLIRNIHQQPARAQQMVQTLVSMAKDLGTQTLAEGIEYKEELEVCKRLGFDLGQGYYLGLPSPDFSGHARLIDQSDEDTTNTGNT